MVPIIVLTLALMNILDALLTMYQVNRFGIIIEANPIMASLYSSIGIIEGTIIKICLSIMLIIGGLLLINKEVKSKITKIFPIFANIIYLAIIVNHVIFFINSPR